MRIAVLADIHGNSWALSAVLEHASRQGVDSTVNLGDIFYGPLDPAGTARLLAAHEMPTVVGNQDRMLLEALANTALAPNPTLDATLAALPPAQQDWLAGLPWVLALSGEVLLCHGTPTSDDTYLLEDVVTGRPQPRSAAYVEAELAGWDYPLVLCGHSHYPRALDTGRRIVVNPGSVGLPAYADDVPPHAVCCGSPHARYAVVDDASGGWRVEFFQVEYDWDAAAACASALGRKDWAICLATGLVGPGL